MGEQSEVSLRSEQEGVRGKEVCAGEVGWLGVRVFGGIGGFL